MFSRLMMSCLLGCSVASLARAAELPQPTAKLTAAEIADKNATARGGLTKWRAVQTLSITGKMEAGGNSRPTLPLPGIKGKDSLPPPRPVEQVRLPFVMELKRPKRMRVEVTFAGQNAIQIYDGKDGWKLRPFLNRREVEPYTEAEIKMAATQSELDGPLIDYAAKGTSIELASLDKVEGHDSYKLKLTIKDGTTRYLWIDATTFLDLKMEGDPARLDGRPRPVEIYFRDFRAVSGLEIPFVVETKVLNPTVQGRGGAPVASEQMTLEKVEVNPALNDALFTKADLVALAGSQTFATRVSKPVIH